MTNISSIGLVAPDFELSQPSYLDVDLLGRALAGNLDFVVGIKARMAVRGSTLRLDLLPYEYSRVDLGPGGEQDG